MKGSDQLISSVPTFSNKQLHSIFDMILSGINDGMGVLCITAFYLKIKPTVDRYNWAIDWAGQYIIFTNKKGVCIPDDGSSTAITKLEKELEKLFEDFPYITRHGILCDVLNGLAYNHYHKDTGLVLVTR
jgi:hypothetical protein